MSGDSRGAASTVFIGATTPAMTGSVYLVGGGGGGGAMVLGSLAPAAATRHADDAAEMPQFDAPFNARPDGSPRRRRE